MIFIVNFNNSRNLKDLIDDYEEYHGTNINLLLDDFSTGSSYWSVPKKAVPGDIIVFMCAATARQNLGLATSHLPENCSNDFLKFVEEQKDLYKKYSGSILGCGTVSSVPEEDGNRWFSDIDKLLRFENPIHIDDFRSFISISKTNSITYINEDQWSRLLWLASQKNPDQFPDLIGPDVEILRKEFDDTVRKEQSKSINELKKLAEKKASKSTSSTAQTKIYHRDPTIAAYVKKRAAGNCQLCGGKAPFTDQFGEPYLECHHIEWLSNGGMDSIDNCVALCPNCHRKMHIVNDLHDIETLTALLKR